MGQQIGAGISNGVVSPAFLIRGVLPNKLQDVGMIAAAGDVDPPRDASAVPPRLAPGIKGCDATGGVGAGSCKSIPLPTPPRRGGRCILLQAGAGMIVSSPRAATT